MIKIKGFENYLKFPQIPKSRKLNFRIRCTSTGQAENTTRTPKNKNQKKSTKFLFLLFSFTVLNLFSEQQIYENITIESAPKDINFAQKIIREFASDIEKFQRKIGLYPDIPVKIYIAEDQKDYLSIINKNMKIMEFSQGFYSSKTNTIYIRNPQKIRGFIKIRKLVLHEYIHLFINYYWKNPPLWFHEGMAVYFSDDLSYDRELNFIKNYILGNSLCLEEMKFRYPKNRIEWESFYAKSALAVKYLFAKKRQEFYTLWDNALPSRDFDKIFLQSFYFTTKDFSNFFEEYSKTHFRAGILLASTGIIWGILPLIFIIGVIRRKIRERRIKKVWEKDNILESEE